MTKPTLVKNSPHYIGMGMLKIPQEIAEAIYQHEQARQQAKQQYGYHKENIIINADNQFVLALEAYEKQAIENYLTKVYGKRCKSKNIDCLTCKVWEHYDEELKAKT